MKNTVLGKIIEEDRLNNQDQRILFALQKKLEQSQGNPIELKKIHEEIMSTEERLIQNGGDEKRSNPFTRGISSSKNKGKRYRQRR